MEGTEDQIRKARWPSRRHPSLPRIRTPSTAKRWLRRCSEFAAGSVRTRRGRRNWPTRWSQLTEHRLLGHGLRRGRRRRSGGGPPGRPTADRQRPDRAVHLGHRRRPLHRRRRAPGHGPGRPGTSGRRRPNDRIAAGHAGAAPGAPARGAPEAADRDLGAVCHRPGRTGVRGRRHRERVRRRRARPAGASPACATIPMPPSSAIDADRLVSDCRWAAGQPEDALTHLHVAKDRYEEVVDGRLQEPARLSPALVERLAEPLFGLLPGPGRPAGGQR